MKAPVNAGSTRGQVLHWQLFLADLAEGRDGTYALPIRG
jgi:hypothetical protein